MAILIFVIGISLLILIHELGHFLAAKMFGLWVEEFGFGFPPRLFGKKIGETVYSINLLPFGGFVKIYGEKQEEEGTRVQPARSFSHQTIARRAAVIAAGVVMNFFLGWLILSSVNLIGVSSRVIVTAVAPGSPAAQIGIEPDDQFVEFQTTSDFISFVGASKGNEVALNVRREGRELTLRVIPRVNPPAGEGALGVTVTDAGMAKLPFLQAVWEGLKTSVQSIAAIAVSLANLVAGIFTGAPILANFVGPVGIFEIAHQTAKFGLVYLLQLIALISLNLAVLNALPLPALDGGRLFFLLIEKLKGSPISAKKEQWANAIGFTLLLFLMAVITVRDVAKLF